jgi:hypothetical protein
LEALEDRLVLSTGVPGFGGNAQHTALSTTPAQSLQAIHWFTPVDLQPNPNLFDIHYESPVITANNTVIVPVDTNLDNNVQLEAFNGATGAPMWTVGTDYQPDPNIGFIPEYGTVLAGNRLYFAGAGGTLFYISNPDMPGPHTATRVAFYGLGNYNADPTDFNNSVFVSTPLTADANGDIFFGIRVDGFNPQGLPSGIARIDPNGNGTFTSAFDASGIVTATSDSRDPTIAQVPYNAAPALSSDESTLYVVLGSADQSSGDIVALNSTTLQIQTNSSGGLERQALLDPRFNNSAPAGVLDISSGSPMVAPDGSVFFGVEGDLNNFNGSRGFMLHFSVDLSQEFTPGAFGWDDTASIVPASMVPSYTGTSSYLIMTKYNNYIFPVSLGGTPFFGDGNNQIAILDPNATQADPHNDGDPNLQVMKEVETMSGPTPDGFFSQFFSPVSVDEWCINSAVVDPATDSVYVNSGDGNLYRWDLANNTLSQTVNLTAFSLQAYTPTVIGPDGTVYAINAGVLFAVGAGQTGPAPVSLSTSSLDLGNQAIGTTSATPKFTNTIINFDAPEVRVISDSITGPDAADFKLLNPPATSPNRLFSMPLNFSFTPSHLGTESATFTLHTNQAVLTVDLTGTGTSPLELSRHSVEFGNQAVGVASSVGTTTLTNVDAGVTLLGIQATGPNAADFTLLNPPAVGQTLAQGPSLLEFAFTPSKTQNETTVFIFHTSVGDINVSLHGTGVLNATPAVVQLSETRVTFGDQPIGVSTTPVDVLLTNLGNGSGVQLLSVTASGNDAADFTLLNPPVPGPLPQGSQTLQFAFSPSHLGSENATFTFSTSAGDLVLSLTGNGTTPLSLSADGADFGGVPVLATSAGQRLVLTNLDHGGHVTLLGITSSSPDAADFKLFFGPANGVLAGGASQILFDFTPSRLGSESATFDITTSAGTLTVTLQGTGVPPLSLLSGAIDLGSIPVGSTTNLFLEQILKVQGSGAGVVAVLQSISVSGPNAADFTSFIGTVPPGGLDLFAGEQLDFFFLFTPSQVGPESATVTFVTNIGDFSFQLNGTGI